MPYVRNTNMDETKRAVAITAVEGVIIEEDFDAKQKKKKDSNSNLHVFNAVAAQREGVITADSLEPKDVAYIRSINTYTIKPYTTLWWRNLSWTCGEDWIAQ